MPGGCSRRRGWRGSRAPCARAGGVARRSQADRAGARPPGDAEFVAGYGVDWGKVERSLALEDPDWFIPHEWWPSTIAGILLASSGRVPEARDRLAAVRDAALDRGLDTAFGFVAFWLGFLDALSGDLRAAAMRTEEMLSVNRLRGNRPSFAMGLALEAFVAGQRGLVDRARSRSAEAVDLAQKIAFIKPLRVVAMALGQLELSLGDAEAAWKACELATTAIEHMGIREPMHAVFLPDAIEAMIALGYLDRAESLLDSLETRAHELDRAWMIPNAGRCRALLLAARGDLDQAAVVVDSALVEHERIDAPVFRARTLLARGVIQRKARRRSDAKRSFEEARDTFERVGATLWAQRARQLIDRLGLRRSSGDELTEGERRVAELAGAGKTNREIADALFVSPKTVQAQLAHVYRKLGIRSRAELGARMTQRLQT